MLTRQDAHAIYRAGEDTVVRVLLEMDARLHEAHRVRQLEEQVAKNSHNSSKPPSSDGLGVLEPEAVTRVRRISPGPHPQSVQTTRSLVRATAKRPWTLPDPWPRGRAHRSLPNRADAVSHKRPPPSSFS